MIVYKDSQISTEQRWMSHTSGLQPILSAEGMLQYLDTLCFESGLKFGCVKFSAPILLMCRKLGLRSESFGMSSGRSKLR
jgi:hypothetical protein